MIFIINKISKNNFVTFKVNIELHSRGYFPMWRTNFKGFAMGKLVSLEKMFGEIQSYSLTLWDQKKKQENVLRPFNRFDSFSALHPAASNF